MKAKNLNNSSTKTKNLIKEKFAELLKEKKELNKITVKELTQRANINRGTFYIHYDSIYGVAEDFEAEILQTLQINDFELKNQDDVNNYFDTIIAYLKKNENLYRKLLSSNGPVMYLTKLANIMTDKLYITLKNNPTIYKSDSLKFDISFFICGIITQILNYFTKDFEYSLDDICRYMKKYFRILFCENTNF